MLAILSCQTSRRIHLKMKQPLRPSGPFLELEKWINKENRILKLDFLVFDRNCVGMGIILKSPSTGGQTRKGWSSMF